MFFFLSIQVGLREILSHKFRSFLTMSGVILGVASLVATSAMIEGITRGAKENLILMGGLEAFSVNPQPVPIEQEDLKTLSPGITLDDALAIKEKCHLISEISPEVSHSDTTLQFYNKTSRPKGGVLGVTPSYLNIRNYSIVRGRSISDLDVENNAQICLIGWPIWEDLNQTFSNDPIGQKITINEIPFKIIGILDSETEGERKDRESGKIEARKKRELERRSKKSRNSAWYRNNIVLIPISTMQLTFKSASIELPYNQKGPDPKLSNLTLKVKNVETLNKAIQQVKSILLKIHRNIEDFGFLTREDWAEDIEEYVRNLRISGGIIAGISLLVGGIGITNIMLASIVERIREIGIRMAVGAHRRDIFFQIMIESTVLGLLGGLIGLAASFGILEIIQRTIDLTNKPVVLFESLVISFAFSVLTGFLAGFFPALKASRLHPIEALRYD